MQFSERGLRNCDGNNIKTDDLPLLGRDNRFFAGALICAGLSFGLLVDREAKFEG